jgi:transcriptional regulator GlxA family with amidase domain
MLIAVLLYDDMTALDAVGAYEVLARLPGAITRFVAERAGAVRVDTGALGLVASHGIDELAGADVLLVPGGPGDAQVRANRRLLDWVRAIDGTTQWTTSVCTGSLILGAAGLLRGRRATSHWTQLEALREYGAEPTAARVVEDGKIVTAAGVSAGIDMALRLAQRIAGDDFAQGVQLGIEYDPEPPFQAGSPAKAPAHVVALVRGVFAALAAARATATAPA